MDIWSGIGLATLIYIAGITAASPQDTYEAAKVDGANWWQTFTKIIVPLVRPATATVIILSLIGGLRSFDLIWTMTTGGAGFTSDVISSVIYKQYQAGFYGLSTAGNVMLFLLVTADRRSRCSGCSTATETTHERHAGVGERADVTTETPRRKSRESGAPKPNYWLSAVAIAVFSVVFLRALRVHRADGGQVRSRGSASRSFSLAERRGTFLAEPPGRAGRPRLHHDRAPSSTARSSPSRASRSWSCWPPWPRSSCSAARAGGRPSINVLRPVRV